MVLPLLLCGWACVVAGQAAAVGPISGYTVWSGGQEVTGHDVLRGFALGLDLEQTYVQQVQCQGSLFEVASPLVDMLSNLTSQCSEALSLCVPSLLGGLEYLSTTSPSVSEEVRALCPRKAWLLFTASYDPFLPANMGALAVLHASRLTSNLNRAVQALAALDNYHFGYYMGRVLDAVIPKLRLPLSEHDLDDLIRGFISAFVSRTFREGPTDLSSEGVSAESQSKSSWNSSEEVFSDCISGVRNQITPANRAVELLAGSLLNVTCYRMAGQLVFFECAHKAVSGVFSFVSVVQEMFRLRSRLSSRASRALCPAEFISAMRRFDDKGNLALDFISNSIEDFGDIERHLLRGADAFFDADLVRLGFDLGHVYRELMEPSFYRYRRIEVPWTSLSPLRRVILIILVPPVLFLLSAVPMLCLFCSACYGRPPSNQQLIIRQVLREGHEPQELSLDYSFFGRGPYAVGSEVDFDVLPLDMEGAESDVDLWAEKLEAVDDGQSVGSSHSSATLASWQESGPMASWGGLKHLARERLRFRLTNELPEMGCLWYAAMTVVWILLPCLVHGQRRWELETDVRRRDGRWTRDLQNRHACLLRRRAVTQPGPLGVSSSSETDGLQREAAISPTDSVVTGPSGAVASRLFLNGIEVNAPVYDVAKPVAFNVSGITEALVRFKPESPYKECWDLLLIIAATAQLAGSIGHIALILSLDFGAVFFGGDLCTMWWWWCCGVSSALTLHKKVHARWWLASHWESRKAADQDRYGPGGLLYLPRTPTPVGLLTPAPCLPHMPRQLPRAASVISGASLIANTDPNPRGWCESLPGWAVLILREFMASVALVCVAYRQSKRFLKRCLLFLRPVAYRFYNNLRKGERVRILPATWLCPGFRLPVRCRIPKALASHRCGAVGLLVDEQPGDQGLHGVAFDDDELGGRIVEYFHRSQFELVDWSPPTGPGEPLKEDRDMNGWSHMVDPQRPGHWHDRLTGGLLRGSAVLWLLSIGYLLVVPTDLVADDDGFMKLHLVASHSDAAFTQQVTGAAFAVQVLCILLEGFMRFTTWAVQRCLLLLLYASF